MKKILLLAALIGATVTSFAQGVVNFNNKVAADVNGPAVDARIFYLNGANPAPGGGTLRAALYGAVGSLSSDASLVLLSNPTDGQTTVDFRTSPVPAGYGYVNPGSSGSRTIPGAGFSTTVTLQIRAWDGGYADYATAVTQGAATGKSNLVVIQTTTGPTDQVIPRLVGLTGFTVIPVPEPSSIALGLLGLGALALIRRRK